VLAVASSCWGQESKDEVIQKLISRVEALEREIAAMKQAPETPAAPAPNEAAAKTPDAPATPATPAPEPPPSADNQNASRFTFHGYADAGFLRNVDGSSVKRFTQGEVDLFTTARISPKVNLLMEAVIETDNQILNNDVPINIERALLQYRHNDYFNLDIGSYRTALGFYSTAYLRGSWFQTAVSRPGIFAFEDDGGFLPLHNAGVSVNGRIPSGALGLHYVFEVGSSRNYAQAGRTGTDLEHNGAVNIAVFAQPSSVHGLQVGFSAYRDKFSPGPGFFFHRSIWMAHAVYQARHLEFLNEVVLEKATAPTFGNVGIPGFYSQAAYRVRSNWSPYLRFDYLNVYGKYVLIDALKQYLPWRTIFSGGVRYDLSEAVAFKFEVGRETGRFQSPWIRAAAQIAFTF
jgi:hypothetical protein